MWSYAVVLETAPSMGTQVAIGASDIYPDFTGSLFFGRINSNANTSGSVATPGSKGLFVAERTSSSATALYWDGVSQGTPADTSGSPVNSPFTIGFVVAQASASAQTIPEAHIGAALGATLNLALYNRLRTYMTAVGVP